MTLGPGTSVFVTGATGLVGRVLCNALRAAGAQVVALSRSEHASEPGLRFVVGDPRSAGDWQGEVARADAVVHLAGEPIAGQRWTEAFKRKLRASRIEGTRRIVEAMGAGEGGPSVLVCASAAGYYGPRGEEVLDESSPPGDDFLAGLCIDWEAEAARARVVAGARVVSLRFGMILATGGGALPRMLTPFRLGLGGPLGPKDRYTPWIHVADAAGLARFAIEASDDGLRGPVNAVAPEAVRMETFARTLGRVLGRPAWIPVPEAALRLILGEAADAVVPGQHVVPRAALTAGYAFVHPTLEGALSDLVG